MVVQKLVGGIVGGAIGAGAGAVLPLASRRQAEFLIGQNRSKAISTSPAKSAISKGIEAARRVEQSKIESARRFGGGGIVGGLSGFVAESGKDYSRGVARLLEVGSRGFYQSDVKKSFVQTTTDELIFKYKYSPEQAKQIALDAYYVSEEAPSIGKAGATVAIESGTEFGGRSSVQMSLDKQLAKAGGKFASQFAAQKAVAKAVIPSLITQGAIEGTAESISSQFQYGEDVTRPASLLKTAQGAVFGAGTATLIGAPIATGSVARQKGAGFLTKLAEGIDFPGEPAGDIFIDYLKIGNVTVPFAVITPSASPSTSLTPAGSQTQTQFPKKVSSPVKSQVIIGTPIFTPTPTPVPSPSSTPTPSTTPAPTPSPVNIPNPLDVPTPTPTTTDTPEPEPTDVPEDTKVSTPVPTPTSIMAAVPTVTAFNPAFPLPVPLPPIPSQGDGGRVGSDRSTFFNEIAAARRLSQRFR